MKYLQNIGYFYLVGSWLVCILGPYLTRGTWHNLVTQNCTQGFAGPW